MRKALLTVAGFDPCSGAGATLDLGVFGHFGYHGLATLTAITIQNSFKLYDYLALSPEMVLQQYLKLKSDFKFSGIKIGMIGNRKIIPVIEEIVSKSKRLPVVVDPVFRSSSGHWLLEKKAIGDYLKAIRGQITLITPNLNEAALILEKKIKGLKEMEEAALKICLLTDSACLIKGGHLTDKAVDILYNGHRLVYIKKKKLPVEVHGTGCFLSSAILCFLADGQPLTRACQQASELMFKLLSFPLRISRQPMLDLQFIKGRS